MNPRRGSARFAWALAVLLVQASCGDSGPEAQSDAGYLDEGIRTRDASVPWDVSAHAPDAETKADAAECAPPENPDTGATGTPLGEFRQTFYWLVLETECDSPPDSPLVDIYDPNGDVLATVSEDFACKLGLEGSGKLADGRVVNYWGSGSACVQTTPCRAPYYPSDNCYSELDAQVYPWGKGVAKRALVPFYSIAVDSDIIPYGTIVYVPEWDGYVLPDGSVHDGCLRADDTGGAIVGDHIDFFAGTEENWRAVASDFPDTVHVFADPERCLYERAWFQAVGAGCCQDEDCWYPNLVCLGSPDFPGGYCSLPECFGGDCPDIGGYQAFCTDAFTGGTCVQRCASDLDCRQGYGCVVVSDLAGGEGQACIPNS